MGGPTVLVADDYPDAADSLAALLTLFGYDARPVYSADAALAAVAATRPDFALVELAWRDGTDGYGLVERLRAAGCPVVVAVTARGRAADLARARAAGVWPLLKPAAPDEVLAALTRRHPGTG